MIEYTNNNPLFTDSVTIIEPNDPVHADVANAAAKQLLGNDLCLKSAVGIPTTPKELKAGQSEVSFTVDNLTEGSGIRVEVADISTLCHRGITIEGNVVKVKFEPQAHNVWVRLVIYNMDGVTE